MPESRPTRALVIGAGIGGLSAAIALRRLGLDAVVFERATDLLKIQVGAGIFLWTNGMRALREIGVADQVEAAGSPKERFEIRTWRDKLLVEWPLGEIGRRVGAPTVAISRADLHPVLARALDPQALKLGAACTAFTQDANGVTARFADGREERGDVLIGADGLHSVVRAQLLGPHKPSYAGYTAWRGIVAESVPFSEETLPRDLIRLFWGRGRRILIYRVGRGRPYWLAMARAPEGSRDPEGGRRGVVLAQYRGWPEPLEALVGATEESAISHVDIFDRPPMKRWGEGRVTVLGDAAHPMQPNTAQGACMGLEDAVVLAKCLSADRDVAAALRAYEALRLPRTAHMVTDSRRLGVIGRWQSPWSCWMRDQLLKWVLNPIVLRQHNRDMAHPL